MLDDYGSDGGVLRDLSCNDTGADVKVLQEILVKRGYTLLDREIDGMLGRQTEAFVVHFQWLHGLNPDGVVGPRTRVALGLTASMGADGETVLSELEDLDLGRGEPLTDHVHVEPPVEADRPIVNA